MLASLTFLGYRSIKRDEDTLFARSVTVTNAPTKEVPHTTSSGVNFYA
jgi:hypothetical protein